MLRSDIRAHSLLGSTRPSRLRACSYVTRVVRPVRKPRLGVSAFKDWFSGLVQPKEPQPQQAAQPAQQDQHASPPQPVSQTAPSKVAPKRDFLEARQVSLFQLFDSSDYKFDIPPYQRPYAWRTKQIYELLQDFVKAYQQRQEYFLGAIVATKAADGAHVPYQLIDGQQRLTSLVILLAFLHGWAREQGNDVLEGRIRRMLYLEADPLDPDSRGRYRLRLRDADDAFFRTNVLDAFLPSQFRLAGVAAAAGSSDTAAAVVSISAGPGPAGGPPGAAAAGWGGPGADGAGLAQPLENETWWRLYENAAFLRSQLDKLVAEGLNLQDFTFQVLRNCFVVMMVARDEGASFRIFSTLNGRGMDLSVVDKLKADLLAGELTLAERSHFADAWAEMESVLGRSAFHRVFDYMRDLAAVRDPWVCETSVLEYFTRKVDDPRAVKQILQVSLDYARLLLQLRQASWAGPELAALLAETPQQLPERESATGSREEDGEEALDAAAAVVAAAVAVQEQPRVLTAEQPRILAPEQEGEHLDRMQALHRQWRADDGVEPSAADGPRAAAVLTEGMAGAATWASDADAAGALGAASAATAQEVGGDLTAARAAVGEEDGVLLFRFDDAGAGVPAAATGTESSGPAAVGATAEDAGADTDVLGSAEGSPEAAMSAEMAPSADSAGAAATGSRAMGAEASMLQASLEEVPVNAPGVAWGPEAADLPPSLPQPQARHGGEQLVAGGAAKAAIAAITLAAYDADAKDADATAAAAVAALSDSLSESVTLSRALEAAEDAAAAAMESERARQAALLAELDERSHHLNLFSDEAWLPPLLEFFYQTDDLEHRVAFMKGAEALQLFLELWNDPAAKAARWGLISEALLQRPFSPEKVLAALSLTGVEKDAFRARLDSKDLYGTVDQRTLRHLLVRCEPPEVVRQLSGINGLLVEKVMPQSAPEGSMWRKTRITTHCDPLSPWPEPWSNRPLAVPTTAGAAVAADGGSPTAGIAADGETEQQRSEPHQLQHSRNAGAAAGSYDVKYWYEVQRLNWHGKLGNLVLLPATAASAAASTADYDAKTALWRRAGVAARLPAFSGPLVDAQGRYGRFKFCYDECRQRHEDMLERLTTVFELF